MLIAYEAKASEGSSNRIYLAQFKDIKAGVEPDQTIEFPASFNSLNEGSPSFERMIFKGDVQQSPFSLYYEFQNKTGETHLAKLKHSVDVSGETSIDTYSLQEVNALFKQHGYIDSFGSRSQQIMYAG